MYHIKSDKRCLRSAAAISDALGELMSKKPYMEISVSDIQKVSGVGRSTFYRLFDTIDDVVSYNVDEEFKQISIGYRNHTWREFTKEVLKGIVEREDAIVNIVTAGRTDLIIRSFRKALQAGLDSEDSSTFTEVQYAMAVFSGACVSVIRIWLENGRTETVDELVDILEKYIHYEALATTCADRK